jgi:uncharacterized protein YndB with AHSA1/START domain
MGQTKFVVEPGKQEIVITGIFNAPRDVLFKILTNPDLIPQWWGPRRFATTVDRMDVKQGGLWRFVQRDSGGREFAFHGVYHDVAEPERLVYTFEFEGMPGHVTLETVTLEGGGGKTTATSKVVFQSLEDRDGMIATGMEEGASETMDRLAELLEKV